MTWTIGSLHPPLLRAANPTRRHGKHPVIALSRANRTQRSMIEIRVSLDLAQIATRSTEMQTREPATRPLSQHPLPLPDPLHAIRAE